MKTLKYLIGRNIKLFFKDKGLFFTALITPLILLVLYVTFLGNVYRDAFLSIFPQEFVMEETLIGGFVGGQLISSLLAVCCVTVAFCSNMLMVQDKINGAKADFDIAPVKGSMLAFGYYIATLFSTLMICLVALAAGLVYLSAVGFYLSAVDVLLLIFDVILLVMFGTALSSVVNFFLSSQGQVSAVGTIVSSGYGFICGAYMPISQFSEGLQTVISFLPGTYATALLRNHCMRGIYNELGSLGISDEWITSIRDSVDCNLYFFGEKVSEATMYAVVVIAAAVLIAGYIALHLALKKRAH